MKHCSAWMLTARNRDGSTAVEFALLAPTFLMFVFLILDGGRMLFAKQSLNEVATATARCAALKATGCTDAGSAQTWAITRGHDRDNLKLVAANVTVTLATTCNSVANMAQASVAFDFPRGAMTFLPQSIAPAKLTSIACFPIAN